MDKQKNKYYYLKGIKNGMPICLGYLAVSFTLGITARNAGMTAWQAMLTSLACNASAGQYAGFTVIAAGGSYFEMILNGTCGKCTLSSDVLFLKPEVFFGNRAFTSYAGRL